MDQEVIETVLNELTEEIKFIRQQNAAAGKVADELMIRLQSIEKKLSLPDTKLAVKEYEKLQQQLNDQFSAIHQKLDKLPEKVTHKKQVLLFPEYGAREYYRMVFGRLFFWLVIILLASYLYSLGKVFLDNWKEVQETKVIKKDNLKSSYHSLRNKKFK